MYHKFFIFILLLIFCKQISVQHVVWDYDLDLCEFIKVKPINERTRCEKLDNILVEKRILRGRLYWCISLENRIEKNKILTIDYDGQRNLRTYDKYEMRELESDIDTQDKYSLEADGVPTIVVYPRYNNSDLQKIISIKVDDKETCDATRTAEADPILPNQKNLNSFRFLNNCFEYDQRPSRPRHVCEKLDEIIIEEFLYNNEIPFYCIIILKNLRREPSSSLSGDILEIKMSNTNNKFSWTSTGVVNIEVGKWNVSGNHIRISARALDVKQPKANILSIMLNGIESCGLQKVQAPIPKPQSTCGEVKLKHAAFIALGRPTEPGEFPWHIALFRLDNLSTRRYICGGTIVTNTVVLTAAHCIVTDNGVTVASDLRIEAGKYDLTTSSLNTKEYQVQSVTIHEKFERKYLENDLGILRVKTYIEFTEYIQPICLANNNNRFVNEIGFVPGWGRNEFNQQISVLGKAGFPIVSAQECRSSNRDFFSQYLNDASFCAGYKNGTSVCTGDSGGGLVFKVDNLWYLKGIVSLGVPIKDRCDITQYVLFTDMVKFYDWMKSNI